MQPVSVGRGLVKSRPTIVLAGGPHKSFLRVLYCACGECAVILSQDEHDDEHDPIPEVSGQTLIMVSSFVICSSTILGLPAEFDALSEVATMVSPN